ncbi:MAG: hypothetical protein ACD_20C00120G0008 [uncultured bacterium]|nr:MAG: hypothetical protein ACD_20C00120G0008 [uncultured bacterium]HBH18902.1 hypothetical protein [Cyanobacteria bacterium UBA9579]
MPATGDLRIKRIDKTSNTIEIPNTISEFKEKKLLIKPLEYTELIIALERLSRFQYPPQKKERVYKEILLKNTISPKISLKNYHNYSLGTINKLVQLIWNTSINILDGIKEPDYSVNTYLAYEEIKAFSAQTIVKDIFESANIKYLKNYDLIRPDTQDIIQDNKLETQIIELLNENNFNIPVKNNITKHFDLYSGIYFLYNQSYPLNISGLLEYAAKHNNNLPDNIHRLIWLNNLVKEAGLNIENEDLPEQLNQIYNKAEKYREKQSAKYPAKLVILVEGATEEKLLPVFADKLGINFDKKGVQLIAAGGKNQVAKLYKKLYQKLNLPILCILDADAIEIAEEINGIIRNKDSLFLIQEGEFEDILPINLICKSINAFHGLTAEVYPTEIKTDISMTTALDNLWKEKGLGEFDKVKFARIVAENIKDTRDISSILDQIIELISKMANT